jgi:DNA modification methylase
MSVKVTHTSKPSSAASVNASPSVSAIEQRPIGSLQASPHNARFHGPKQIAQLKAGIKRFGFLVPILIDADNVILAGHGRLMAAQALGLETVPTILVDHLTSAEKRAYMLADNKVASNAGWDERQLAIELDFLCTQELEFDVELTGFETFEIDQIQLGNSPTPKAKPDPDDAVPVPVGPPVSQPGDLWELGIHRLLCGNALERDDLAVLMRGEEAELVITDPPYNVPIQGHVGGAGKTKHREFVMASGEMSAPEFIEFLRSAFNRMVENSKDGAIAFVFMDWRHMHHVLEAGDAFSELKNLCVWDKGVGGMGTFYRSQHEMAFVFKNGTDAHINNFGLGDKGRYRTNVWKYPGINTFKKGRLEELNLHPTVKPVAMIADAIRDCSHRKGIVLDPFAGSGTILIAAEKTGRIARALELDPLYVDTAIERWQAYTGHEAIHTKTGLTYVEMKAAPREPIHV